MADFPVIANTSNQLLRFFRESLCPEILASPESIQLVAPTDKNADFQVGLHLYDIQDLHELRTSEHVRTRANVKTLPPKLLNLYYVLYLNSKAQIASSAEVEQRVLARAMQALYDHAHFEADAADAYGQDQVDTTVTFLNMTFEDKTKIWSSMNIPYQVGLYFSVSPVTLSSRTEERFTRVGEMELHTERLDG